MARAVVNVNPEILRWARERAGYSLAEIAAAFNKEVEEVESWETGQRAPTYVQLEQLAYRFYKRPIAIFFFPEPPAEADPAQEFRTIPGDELERLNADTRYAIRLAESMKIALYELNDGANRAQRCIFRDIEARPEDSPRVLSMAVREYLGVPIREQMQWRSNEIACKQWRARVEEAGIFIFKRSFKQKDISGFCLIDDEFPLIYVNNSTADSRQTFTIFHELAHILLHTNGITKQDDRYINDLAGWERSVEVFCNEFAAEFLVPSEDFDRILRRGEPFDDVYVSELADRYSVSREVILRKILDRDLVDQKYYERKATQWRQEYEAARDRQRRRGGGGNYYATQASYLGENYLKLAFSRYYQGRVSVEQLADYLNIKARNVPALETFVFRNTA